MKEFTYNGGWLEIYLRIGPAKGAWSLRFEKYRIGTREHTAALRRQLGRKLAQRLRGEENG